MAPREPSSPSAGTALSSVTAWPCRAAPSFRTRLTIVRSDGRPVTDTGAECGTLPIGLGRFLPSSFLYRLRALYPRFADASPSQRLFPTHAQDRDGLEVEGHATLHLDREGPHESAHRRIPRPRYSPEHGGSSVGAQYHALAERLFRENASTSTVAGVSSSSTTTVSWSKWISQLP